MQIHKHRLIAAMLLLALLLTGCGKAAVTSGSETEQSASESQTTPTTPAASQAVPTPPYDPLHREPHDEVVSTLWYSLGDESWSSPAEIDPDAFVDYYLATVSHHIYRENLPEDEERNHVYGGEFILGSDLERLVLKHFDVTVEQIRASTLYDPETGQYRARTLPLSRSGCAIGEVVEEGDLLIIHYQRFIMGEYYQAAWQNTATVRQTADGYQYLSYERGDISEQDLTEGGNGRECAAYYRYIDPFVYSIGADSWENAEQIDPDAFLVYYVGLSGLGEVTSPLDGPRDEEFGNLLIPAEVMERAVQRHFDVSSEHMRKSMYYDPDTNSYWCGGIGTVVEVEVTHVTKDGEMVTIGFESRIDGSTYSARWDSVVQMRITEDGYQYLSYWQGEREAL